MPQTATVHSAMLAGLDVMPLTVDVDIRPGLPNVTLVGVAGADTHEAVSRVRSAIRSAGYEMPHASVIVQVLPSTTRPRGTQLDLAIAVAILAATGQVVVPPDALFVGELALDGRIMSTRGLACYGHWCSEHALALVCPTSSEHISHVPVDTLAELRSTNWEPTHSPGVSPAPRTPADPPEPLKAAMDAAMDHCAIILLRGADGPVSRAVRALHASLPQLTQAQCTELSCIHSACLTAFEGEPPFRAPHHSISCAGLVGGGRPVIPGEVTLATHGLLLVSDIERWSQTQLQVLSVALEGGVSRIVRVEGTWVMPAAPSMVIATTTDTRAPADQLLRPLSKLGFEEVSL